MRTQTDCLLHLPGKGRIEVYTDIFSQKWPKRDVECVFVTVCQPHSVTQTRMRDDDGDNDDGDDDDDEVRRGFSFVAHRCEL